MYGSYCGSCNCGMATNLSKEDKVKLLEIEEKTLEQQLALVREAKKSAADQKTDSADDAK